MGRTVKVKSKTGVVYPIHLYDTAAGAGDAGNGTDVLNVGGKYARMTTNLSGACGKDTPLRVKKGGNIYQVAQYGEYRATPVANLYVLDENVMKYNKRDKGWIGDGESAYYEIHWSDSGSNTNFNYVDVTIPRNCSVVRLEGYAGETANNTLNVKVTPGKRYRIISFRSEKQENRTLWEYHTRHDGGHVIGGSWVSHEQAYCSERCRQLLFAYIDFTNSADDKKIILTTSLTQGSVQTGTRTVGGMKNSHKETIDIGVTDAIWGNGGFMRVCFGKGHYNYEANTPQDTML